MGPRSIIEPFRIHTVEPITFHSAEEREVALRTAGYNLFGLRAEDVIIDLRCRLGSGPAQAPWLRHFTARFELA